MFWPCVLFARYPFDWLPLSRAWLHWHTKIYYYYTTLNIPWLWIFYFFFLHHAITENFWLCDCYQSNKEKCVSNMEYFCECQPICYVSYRKCQALNVKGNHHTLRIWLVMVHIMWKMQKWCGERRLRHIINQYWVTL